MRKLRYIAIGLFIALPTLALADSIPAFPMAFWGNVTINGNPAPVGTVVNAYYGSALAGTVSVQDAGVYGYTDPTKQKLVIGDGTGAITFTVQSSPYNNGAETGGTNQPNYSGFTSGTTVENNLAFTISVPAATVSSGGGGGGGGAIIPAAAQIIAATSSVSAASSTTATSTPIAQTPANAPAVLGASAYNFTKNLQIGSSGADVTALQQLLTAQGLYSGPITGYFGQLTMAAVKAFQKMHGIQQVGDVGPQTRAALNQGTTPTMSDEQRSLLIQQLEAEVQQLMAQIQVLLAQQATSTAH